MEAKLSKEREIFRNRVREDGAEMITDDDAYRYRSKPEEPDIIAATNLIRANEPRWEFSKVTTPFTAALLPLADSDPKRLDAIIQASCAEIVHDRIWDVAMPPEPYNGTFPDMRALWQKPG